METRKDTLGMCPNCKSGTSKSEGYYGSALAWRYELCDDCGYWSEGEAVEDENGILEWKEKEHYPKVNRLES